MPSDILGSEILDENRQFKFIKGPIFSNIILADEINRTPPKTQAAFALGITLFFFTLVINIIALNIVKKFREKYE